ncbi:MAG: hypothetical protein MK168_03255 [Candidatus Thalassarchaeum sp.]|nr:hypothetical protein [Candidatus Thalassarchaeum sp.]
MVDVDSALRASAYSGKKGKGSPGAGEKASTELEPFDPSSHADKEKADAVSMWLVISFGLFVALSMRYLLMPTMEEPKQVLWLLPVLLVGLVQPLHRALLPSGIFERYTGGNWFRASFLYLFTWLALSFALVNPPLADIAAPHLAGDIDVKSEAEMIEGTSFSKGDYLILIDEDTVDITLGLAVRDNVDAANSTMTMIIYEKDNRDQPLVSVQGTAMQIAAAGPSSTFDDVEDEEWLRGLEKNTLTGKYGGPKVAPIAQDIGMAWVLCPGGCDVGKYFVEIELVEDDSRVPWSTTQNVWSAEFTLTVMKAAT